MRITFTHLVLMLGLLATHSVAWSQDTVDSVFDSTHVELSADSTASDPDQKEPETTDTQQKVPEENEAQSIEETAEAVKENVENAFSAAYELLSPSKILVVLLIVLFTYLFIRVLDFIFGYLALTLKRYKFFLLRLQPILNVILWTMAIYSAIITIFEENTNALWGLTGSSALALGFAAQDFVKNIVGGLMIIFDRPFQRGDYIRIGEYYGVVDKIGMRVTRIITLDDSLVTIPNSRIVSDSVADANSGLSTCMVVVNLWLPVQADLDIVKKIAYEAAITSRYLNIDREVKVLFFEEFHERPITHVMIKAYVFDAKYEKAFESDVTEAAKKALGQAKIWQEDSIDKSLK